MGLQNEKIRSMKVRCGSPHASRELWHCNLMDAVMFYCQYEEKCEPLFSYIWRNIIHPDFYLIKHCHIFTWTVTTVVLWTCLPFPILQGYHSKVSVQILSFILQFFYPHRCHPLSFRSHNTSNFLKFTQSIENPWESEQDKIHFLLFKFCFSNLLLGFLVLKTEIEKVLSVSSLAAGLVSCTFKNLKKLLESWKKNDLWVLSRKKLYWI